MHIYLIPIHQTFNRTKNRTALTKIYFISAVLDVKAERIWGQCETSQSNDKGEIISGFQSHSLDFFLAINWKFINRIELAIRAYTRFTRTKCVSCSSQSLLFTLFFWGNFVVKGVILLIFCLVVSGWMVYKLYNLKLILMNIPWYAYEARNAK